MLLLTEYFAPHPGGTAVYYHQLLRHMPSVEWTVVARTCPGSRRFDREQPVRIVRTPFPPVPKVRLLAEWVAMFLWGLVLTLWGRVDVLHAGQLFPVGLLVLALHRLTGRPYVVYLHGEELAVLGRAPRTRRAVAAVLRSAGAIFANSHFTMRELARFGVGRERVHLVRPGVDLARFSSGDGRALRERLAPPGCKVLLTVGRLIPRKGQDTVIRLLRTLGARIPVVYWIAGDGTPEERARLEALARECGVAEKVRFLGVVPDEELPALYAACDVFVMLNRTTPSGDVEGFGMVFLEAAACGRPAVGGRSGGAVEAIRHGVTGYLVADGEDQAAIEVLARLLQDPPLAARLGLAGRRLARRHGWGQRAARVARVCAALCRPAPPATVAPRRDPLPWRP
jgi:phosphatidylinositol alpha-1,6-mannosyltransferase